MSAPARRVTFEGSGGDALAARLDLPVDVPVAFALFAHCFTCSKDLAAASRIARGLVEQGIGVLRFDFTGLGSSGGEFANTTFSSNVDDLIRAAAYLREHHQAPRILIGHSLGGAAILAAAARIPEAQAVATIGAPFEPAHVTRLFDTNTLAVIDRGGEVTVRIGGRPFQIRKQFLDDVNEQHLGTAISDLRQPLLVFHPPATSSSTSTTPDGSSRRPSTPRASSPSTTPTTSSPARPTPAMWPACSPPGPAATSTHQPTKPRRRSAGARAESK